MLMLLLLMMTIIEMSVSVVGSIDSLSNKVCVSVCLCILPQGKTFKVQELKPPKMEDDPNGGQPKWKTTKLEDDQKRKTTKMEKEQNGRRPKWKTTKMEDDQNGRRPKWKT